jgi:hypothetical protein
MDVDTSSANPYRSPDHNSGGNPRRANSHDAFFTFYRVLALCDFAIALGTSGLLRTMWSSMSHGVCSAIALGEILALLLGLLAIPAFLGRGIQLLLLRRIQQGFIDIAFAGFAYLVMNLAAHIFTPTR